MKLEKQLKKRGSGITLKKNEIKDVMKVIKSLENRGILLKGNTRINDSWSTINEKCTHTSS